MLLLFIVQVCNILCVRVKTTLDVIDQNSEFMCGLSSSHLWSQDESAYSGTAAELL